MAEARRRCVGTLSRALPSLLVCGGLVGAACADLSPPRDPWQSWSKLQLKAKAGPLFSGRVEMNLETGPDGQRLGTRSTAKFMGVTLARTRTGTVFDGPTGRTKSYRQASSKRGRRYLFGDESYTVEKLRPPARDELPLDDVPIRLVLRDKEPTEEELRS